MSPIKAPNNPINTYKGKSGARQRRGRARGFVYWTAAAKGGLRDTSQQPEVRRRESDRLTATWKSRKTETILDSNDRELEEASRIFIYRQGITVL